jgi:hypothetical protein
VNRRHLSLVALAAVLVALWIGLAPFGWRNPYKAKVDCSPAVASVWETSKAYVSTLPAPTSGFRTPGNPFPGASGPSQTDCAKHARLRLETSGVLLGLTLAGWLVGQRILTPLAA